MEETENIMLEQYFYRGFKSIDFKNYLLYRDYGKYKFDYSSMDAPLKYLNPFGCTTFRKGIFVGRSFDYYKNDVASVVVHAGSIDNIRYESIGTCGCSEYLRRDSLISGLFEDQVNKLMLGFTVDGINENGVCISALVVPRGDKGITTGTNEYGEKLSSICVVRFLLDKSISAKDSIRLLSERNIYQPWDIYELHWMISDSSDTYVVETVDNKLSYLGPSKVDEIEGYNGVLKDNVITNFYLTDFNSELENVSTFEMPVTNPTVTPHGNGLERYKQMVDSLLNKNPHTDTGALKIIKELSYEQLYSSDNKWYTDFVNEEFTVDTDVSEGSEFITYITELKNKYNEIKYSNNKIRNFGKFWHSNHQSGFNLNKKTMLICPSESKENAYRIHLDGSIEKIRLS